MEKWDAQGYKLHDGEATLTEKKNQSFFCLSPHSHQIGGPPTWLVLQCVACDVSIALMRRIPVQGERVQTDAADSERGRRSRSCSNNTDKSRQ